jgi:hypothetical protein
MRWARHVARVVEKRNGFRFVAGKPEGQSSLGSPRRRLTDITKMDVE